MPDDIDTATRQGAPAAASAGTPLLAPWDGNPVLARLEANRIRQMTERYRITKLLDDLEASSEEQREMLRAMLGSRAFAAGERLSRLRRGGRPVFSRDDVRRTLGD